MSNLSQSNSIVVDSIDSHYRMRIKEIRMLPARELMNHDGNWRMHPIFQKEALIGDLEEIGITDVLKAYHSEREGGKLVLIDGHLRKDVDSEQLWVVIILDLNDEEADKQLAMHDSIGEMALVDAVKLDDLISKSHFENKRLKDAAERIKAEVEESARIARQLLGQDDDEEDTADGGKKERVYDGFISNTQKSVKVVISIGDDLETFEKAIKATKQRNRAKALMQICQFYLDMAGN